MARALFVGLPLHGHTNPSLPLVRALVDRGDEVVYVSTDSFATVISRAGARLLRYTAPAIGDLRSLSERTDRISWLLMETTREVLVHDLATFRAERPDYVITDSVAPWGQWVAQILDVPVVTSMPTFAVNRRVMTQAATRGTRPKSVRLVVSKLRHVVRALRLRRRLRRHYQVRGTSLLGMAYGSSGLNIVYTSRQFQPCAETFDDRFQFIGPSIELRRESDDEHADERWAAGVVYVSLGTLFNTDRTFYQACFEAFREQPFPVVIAIGSTVDASSLGVPPSNVTVAPWVAQLDILQRASVFVSHGGMNSVSESLHHGVPLVIVPQMGEQEIVARQVEALGAGLLLLKEQLTAERLRSAVQRLREDDGFRRRAAVVRQSFDEAGGAARGADAIIAYTRGADRR